MPGKELEFDNGDVVDACDHEVIDADGANPICWKCGDVNPEETNDE